MDRLLFHMPPSGGSSPDRVAHHVWANLYEARDDLEADLVLVSDDPGERARYADAVEEAPTPANGGGDSVSYFPVSPTLGVRSIHRALLARRFGGARLVCDYHGDLRIDLSSHLRNREVGPFLYTVPSAIMAPAILGWHEAIVLHSRYLEGIVRGRYRLRSRTVIIPNGIEPEIFERGHERMEMEGDFNLCFHGRHTHEKGLDLLLRAIASLPPATSRGVHLYLAGRGPTTPALRSLAARLGMAGRVHFVGYRPMEEVYSMLSSADATVLPSRFDNFPVSILEACALARGPVLFSDRMGISEFTGPGMAGNCFPLSVDAVRSAVLRAVEGGFGGDVVAEQRRFARRHTWDSVIQGYVDLFNDLD